MQYTALIENMKIAATPAAEPLGVCRQTGQTSLSHPRLTRLAIGRRIGYTFDRAASMAGTLLGQPDQGERTIPCQKVKATATAK